MVVHDTKEYQTVPHNESLNKVDISCSNIKWPTPSQPQLKIITIVIQAYYTGMADIKRDLAAPVAVSRRKLQPKGCGHQSRIWAWARFRYSCAQETTKRRFNVSRYGEREKPFNMHLRPSLATCFHLTVGGPLIDGSCKLPLDRVSTSGRRS
jgi:hypothetical protein